MEQNEAGSRMLSNQDLKRLVLSLIVEQILAVSIGMMGAVMISNAGGAATSEVSSVDMVNTLFINILAAVVTGGAVVSSQYLGQRRRDRACQSANQLILITGVMFLVIMGLCILFRQGVLILLHGGVAGDAMANALVYLIISAPSYPFLVVYNSCTALFRSMGNSKISIRASVIMNIINVIGDALSIFVLRWSVTGAAAASLVPRMTTCFILLLRLRNENLDIFIEGRWKFNLRMVKQILGMGIPNGIEDSIFQLGKALVVGIVAMFGTTQIAANAIANNLDGMDVLSGQAVNLVMITVVGRCVGTGDFDQAGYYAKRVMKIAYTANGLCCIAVILTIPISLSLYRLSRRALKLGAILVLVHDGCAVFSQPSSFCLANVLRAASDVRSPICVSILSMIIFHIGFSYLLVMGLGTGTAGVWWAVIADWSVRSTLFGRRFASGRWRTFYEWRTE